jgi:hypothetical protein
MRVRIQMLEAASVKRGRSANDTMYFVALGEEKLCQVGSILPRDSRDKSNVPALLLSFTCYVRRTHERAMGTPPKGSSHFINLRVYSPKQYAFPNQSYDVPDLVISKLRKNDIFIKIAKTTLRTIQFTYLIVK